MLGFLHVLHLKAGVHFEGYISPSNDLKFTDIPSGCLSSLEALPALSWIQILAVCLAAETGYAITPQGLVPQDKDKEPGDIGGSGWVRYEDEGEKIFKLNVERQNCRAAMLGVTGCLIHELLGVDALFPIGGYDGAAPDFIIDPEKSFSNFPAFIP